MPCVPATWAVRARPCMMALLCCLAANTCAPHLTRPPARLYASVSPALGSGHGGGVAGRVLHRHPPGAGAAGHACPGGWRPHGCVCACMHERVRVRVYVRVRVQAHVWDQWASPVVMGGRTFRVVKRAALRWGNSRQGAGGVDPGGACEGHAITPHFMGVRSTRMRGCCSLSAAAAACPSMCSQACAGPRQHTHVLSALSPVRVCTRLGLQARAQLEQGRRRGGALPDRDRELDGRLMRTKLLEGIVLPLIRIRQSFEFVSCGSQCGGTMALATGAVRAPLSVSRRCCAGAHRGKDGGPCILQASAYEPHSNKASIPCTAPAAALAEKQHTHDSRRPRPWGHTPSPCPLACPPLVICRPCCHAPPACPCVRACVRACSRTPPRRPSTTGARADLPAWTWPRPSCCSTLWRTTHSGRTCLACDGCGSVTACACMPMCTCACVRTCVCVCACACPCVRAWVGQRPAALQAPGAARG